MARKSLNTSPKVLLPWLYCAPVDSPTRKITRLFHAAPFQVSALLGLSSTAMRQIERLMVPDSTRTMNGAVTPLWVVTVARSVGRVTSGSASGLRSPAAVK